MKSGPSNVSPALRPVKISSSSRAHSTVLSSFIPARHFSMRGESGAGATSGLRILSVRSIAELYRMRMVVSRSRASLFAQFRYTSCISVTIFGYEKILSDLSGHGGRIRKIQGDGRGDEEVERCERHAGMEQVGDGPQR